MSQTLLVIVIVIAGSIAIPLWMGAVLWLIHRVGGWNRFAREFGTEEVPRGHSTRIASFVISYFGRYNNIASLHLAPDRAFVTMPKLLRVGQPNLSFPYASLRFVGTAIFGGRKFEVTGPSGRTHSFSMYGAAARQLEEQLQQSASRIR